MTQRDQDWLAEALSAYVDGELSAEERAEVERRVRSDPEARALLTELQRTSALLSSLPRHSAPVSVLDEIERHVERHALIGAPVGPVESPRKRGRWMLATSGLAAAIAVCFGGWWYLGLDGAKWRSEMASVRAPIAEGPIAAPEAAKKEAKPGAEGNRVAMRRLDTAAPMVAADRAQPVPSPAPALRAGRTSTSADSVADAAITAGDEARGLLALAGGSADANTIRLRVEVPDDAARDRVLAAVRGRSAPAGGMPRADTEFKEESVRQAAPGSAGGDDVASFGITVDRDELRGIVQSVGGLTDGRAKVSLVRGDARWEGGAAVDTAVEALFPARTAGTATASPSISSADASPAAEVERNAPTAHERPTLGFISDFLRAVGVGPDVSGRIAEALDEAREAAPSDAAGDRVADETRKDDQQRSADAAPIGGREVESSVASGSSTPDAAAGLSPHPALGPEYGPAAPDAPSMGENVAAAKARTERAPAEDRRRSLVARAIERLNEVPEPSTDVDEDTKVDAAGTNDRLAIEIEVVVVEPRPPAPTGRPAENPKPAKPADGPPQKR